MPVETSLKNGLHFLFITPPGFCPDWLETARLELEPDIHLTTFTWPRFIWPGDKENVRRVLFERVDHVLATLKSPRILVGFAQGACLSLDYACRHNDKLEGLLLINPVEHFSVSHPDKSWISNYLPRKPGLAKIRAIYKHRLLDAHLKAALIHNNAARLWYWDGLEQMYFSQWAADLPIFKKPAWLVREGASLTTKLSGKFETKLPYKKVQEFPEWSALPMLDQADDFIANLKEIASSMYYWDWA